MKLFSRFLVEAESSKVSDQAKKLNLKSDGHGGWYDSRGEFVAKTEGGKLKFYNQRQRAGQDPPQNRGGQQAQGGAQAKGGAAAPPPRERKPKADANKSDLDKTLDTLTVVFGRFNPPTAGHEKLLQAAEKAAGGGDLKIYPSRTVEPKKNPIDPDMKVSYMRKMFPQFEDEIINDPEMRSIFNVLIAASEEGYKSINIVVGADRLGEFESLATKYNGSEYFDFPDGIKTISAGPREDDAEGVEGISSSKLRKAVVDDDFKAFKKGLPKSIDDGDAQALFDAVRTGMQVKKPGNKEAKELWQIAPRLDQQTLREKYVTKKVFKIGDIVESLNTGMVGEIIRRGTNYLICVTTENVMFKSWIRDLNEKVIPASKTGVYGVPAKKREVGTSSHRKYAQSMVAGQEEIKNFNIKEFINKYRKNK